MQLRVVRKASRKKVLAKRNADLREILKAWDFPDHPFSFRLTTGRWRRRTADGPIRFVRLSAMWAAAQSGGPAYADVP